MLRTKKDFNTSHVNVNHQPNRQEQEMPEFQYISC